MDEMDRMERLICRKLDGELTVDEQAELDRERLRNPELRALLAEYEQIDAACGDALRSVVAASDSRQHRQPIRMNADGSGSMSRSVIRMPRLWWVMPVAAAACIAVFGMLDRGATIVPPDQSEPATVVDGGQMDERPVERRLPMGRQKVDLTNRPTYVDSMHGRRGERPSPMDYGIIPASAQVPRVQRHRDTEIIGVPGEDGKVYLIEVQRTRTYSETEPQLRRRLLTRGL